MEYWLYFLLVFDVLLLLIASVYLLNHRKRCPKKKMVNPWEREWNPIKKKLHYDSYDDLMAALEEKRKKEE